MPSNLKAIGARRGPKFLDLSPAGVTLTIVAGIITGGLLGAAIVANPFATDDHSAGPTARPTSPAEKRDARKPDTAAAGSEPIGYQQRKSSNRDSPSAKKRHAADRKIGSPNPLPAPTTGETPESAAPETPQAPPPQVPQTPVTGTAPEPGGTTGATSPAGTAPATGTTGP
jgi:hypothetical protein